MEGANAKLGSKSKFSEVLERSIAFLLYRMFPRPASVYYGI